MTTDRAPLAGAVGEEQRLGIEPIRKDAALEAETAAREQLDRAIIEATDNERHRLAQILHDTLCQSLGGIALLARVVLRGLDAGQRDNTADVVELGRAIGEATREVHSLVHQLRSLPLDGPEMIAALADLSTAPLRGIPCEFQCPDPVVVVDPFAAAQLVQIAYQAVQDALKRPGIQRIFIALSGGEGCIALTISDDGQRSASGRSLEGSASEELLRLRARAIGASLTISFQADRGTSILCKLPLHR